MADVRTRTRGRVRERARATVKRRFLSRPRGGKTRLGNGLGDGLFARVLEDDSRCSQRPSRSGGGDGDGGQDRTGQDRTGQDRTGQDRNCPRNDATLAARVFTSEQTAGQPNSRPPCSVLVLQAGLLRCVAYSRRGRSRIRNPIPKGDRQLW
ncbi:hypothetical protein V8C34DRAFT_147600 [Trichoderma compactum]